MFPGPSLGEKGREGVVISRLGGVRRVHVAVHSDAMLQAVQLPARVAHLDTGLANMNGDNFTHFRRVFDVLLQKVTNSSLSEQNAQNA